MIKGIINYLNKKIPKRNLIIFNSFPDASGNPLALYKYIKEERKDIVDSYEIIWTANNNIGITKNKIRTFTGCSSKVIKKKSFWGLIKFLRAKYIITSHNYISGIYTNLDQIHINLWHGMTFKTIGKMLSQKGSDEEIQADIAISTSPVFQDLMARSIGINREKVLISGQPCTDILFRKSSVIERLGIKRIETEKLILWLPTYRKSIVGAIREDGKVDSFGAVDVLNRNIEQTDEILNKKGYVLIIKPHPMDIINQIDFPESTRIRVIKQDELDKAGIELYELMAESDVLLTDYSSAFIDYLILERPIAFVCDDIETYEDTRGFCFNPPRNYLPGELITNYSQFENYLEYLDEINNKWKSKLHEIKGLFISHADSCSCERVVNSVFGISSELNGEKNG